MTKFKAAFKDKGKAAVNTGMEVAALGGTMLVTAKFLDFKMLFKNRIEKDPSFVNKWWVRHQGLWKLGGGIGLAIYAKNPWLRLVGIAVALVGFVQEVITLTTDKAGTSIFNAIGQGNNNATDQQLMEAAKNVVGQENPTTEYPTTVGQENPTTEYPTLVGAWDMQSSLMPSYATSVGQRW